MKYRIMNIQVLKNEILPAAENDFTETGFISPEHLGEGVYGWQVQIRSKLNNRVRSNLLFVETSSCFQFSAGKSFIDDFNQGMYLEAIVELIYAAHCHHAAVFNTLARNHPGFDDLIPRFVPLREVQEATEEAMRNARPI
ncbi:MAG TPA: hypothetical protein VGO45_10320 [Bacteroidia bacterium]|nr:hypothetical protein [Bacteroidia bacterium]